MPASLLALLDDISLILDDVVLLTKAASKKTAGVLGDDLALNAQQVAGVKAERELPVVWAVARGSLVNKAIIVPAAFLISVLVPWLVLPLLMIGGAFLCYEGCHKLAHRWLHTADDDRAHHQALVAAVADPAVDLVAVERAKIKGAVRTDFILSAEIIVITLGTVADASVAVRIAVLCAIALVMTVGVYGLVAGIVRLDDAGRALVARPGGGAQALGRILLALAPRLMRFLAVAGTAAMFMVGGGIVAHAIGPLHRAITDVAAGADQVAAIGAALAWLVPSVANAVVGVIVGAVVLVAVLLGGRLIARARR
ncbi:MAG: DUF808 domain-containing protein [Myxococcales bacterium]|nr:DUF808 domain-containing protein [Myxococcales bacterium]